MKKFVFGLVALCASQAMAGVMVSEPAILNDYIAVTFDVQEDNPTIKADGLLVSNKMVWVEKVDPIFETEFSEYDFPFTTYNLTPYVASNGSGTIVTGFGDKGLREMQYFGGNWVWQSWYKVSQASVPEPSTLGMAMVGVLAMFRRKR